MNVSTRVVGRGLIEELLNAHCGLVAALLFS